MFIGSWPSVATIQVALVAAGGSTTFVKAVTAIETLAVGVLMVTMFGLHRNLAGPWARAASMWMAAAGMLAPALVPDRITLILGFLGLAWMGQSVTTLRTVISDARDDHPSAGQERVQAWVYRTLLGSQVVYVAVASLTGSWRYANMLFAAVIVVEGWYMLAGRAMRQVSPRTIHLPGSGQELRDALDYPPAIWAVLSVALTYVIYGLFFAQAQTQLAKFGVSPGAASWVVVGIGAVRALTLRRAPARDRDPGRFEGEEHHGRALIVSGAVMGASVVALGATLLPIGLLGAAAALIVSGVLLQYAMNRGNPIVRGYLAERSVAISSLLNIGAFFGAFFGGLLSAYLRWPALVAICVVCATSMIVLAWMTMRHRYEADEWRPKVPKTDLYEFSGRRAGPHFRYVIIPGGLASIRKGSGRVLSYAAGRGVDISIRAPKNRRIRYQYWRKKLLFRILWAPLTFERWLHKRRRRASVDMWATAATGPVLELVGWPGDCLVCDDSNGTWFVDLRAALPRHTVWARGKGWAPCFDGDSGMVAAEISYRGVGYWEVIERLRLEPGMRLARLAPGGQIYAERRLDPRHRPRWVIPAAALELKTEIVTRTRGDFPAGRLAVTPYHY
jgi:hypothetical protein